MTMLEEALAYAARGWRVIPVPPGEKFPRGFEQWQDQATTDEETIRDWWTRLPAHGIGIACGPASNLWVLDIDIADGKAGDETLADLEDGYGHLPATWEVITGSGGRHYYFTWPDNGQEVRNEQSGLLGAGIDVRGDGGFVVAPPSLHPNGQTYEVEASSTDQPAAAPPWLLALLRPPEVQPRIERAPDPDAGTRPGDIWANTTTWHELLTADGWTHHHTARNGEDYWTRPGKDRREGSSATVGYQGNDMLWVGTTSMSHAGLQSFTSYDKLGYLAATRFDGSISAAATWCRQQGHHTPTAQLDDLLGASLQQPGDPTQPATPLQLPATPDAPWDTPAPLPSRETATTPPWPADVLPAWVQAQVDNVAASVQCPPDIPGTFALGALATIALGHLQVEVRPGRHEWTSLYAAVVAEVSEGKTPGVELMFAPVEAHEDQLRTWAADALANYEVTVSILEEQVAGFKKQAVLGDDQARKQMAAKKTEAALLERPPSGRVMTDDITPERLGTLMSENNERMSVVSDEAGALTLDRYGDKKRGSNINLYLQAWSGKRVNVDRQTAPSVLLRRPLLNFVVGAQPQAWDEAMAEPAFRVRGLGARFMACRPPRTAAHRIDNLARDIWDHQAADTYATRLSDLARRYSSWATPKTLALNPGARLVHDTWATQLTARTRPGGDLDHEIGWVSKLKTTVIRVAALLHMADSDTSNDHEIEAATMTRACRLGDYWIGHRLIEPTPDEDNVTRLLEWLIARTPRAIDLGIARSDLQKNGPRKLRTIAEYTPALTTLLETGHVRLIGATGDPNQQVSAAIRTAVGIQVHPQVIEERTCAMPRDSARSAQGEHNETTQNAEGTAHVAQIAIRPCPETLPPTTGREHSGHQGDPRDAAAATAPHAIPHTRPDDPPTLAELIWDGEDNESTALDPSESEETT